MHPSLPPNLRQSALVAWDDLCYDILATRDKQPVRPGRRSATEMSYSGAGRVSPCFARWESGHGRLLTGPWGHHSPIGTEEVPLRV